jgi:uncharacterized protein YlxP (DUF503 family)
MYLAMLRLEVRILDGPRAKRRTVQAMVDKLHRNFNVSVSEVDRANHPSESVLGVAAIAATRKEVREVLDRVADAVSAHPRAEILALELTDPFPIRGISDFRNSDLHVFSQI